MSQKETKKEGDYIKRNLIEIISKLDQLKKEFFLNKESNLTSETSLAKMERNLNHQLFTSTIRNQAQDVLDYVKMN